MWTPGSPGQAPLRGRGREGLLITALSFLLPVLKGLAQEAEGQVPVGQGGVQGTSAPQIHGPTDSPCVAPRPEAWSTRPRTWRAATTPRRELPAVKDPADQAERELWNCNRRAARKESMNNKARKRCKKKKGESGEAAKGSLLVGRGPSSAYSWGNLTRTQRFGRWMTPRLRRGSPPRFVGRDAARKVPGRSAAPWPPWPPDLLQAPPILSQRGVGPAGPALRISPLSAWEVLCEETASSRLCSCRLLGQLAPEAAPLLMALTSPPCMARLFGLAFRPSPPILRGAVQEGVEAAWLWPRPRALRGETEAEVPKKGGPAGPAHLPPSAA